ncbi:hypothetical protein PHYBOEH_001301 [Phytophthora boehmeriae]|uniref:Uncharacterized protein n=1 Tax=Phytophthora boehmeriae TaxID=109152 RepID=A0A8T1WTE5_9STRA|nr:hypothetical protein PHYBOEH_001301 [Phytophthora boehmeriae]
MVQRRALKKNEHLEMLSERKRLESEVKRCLANLSRAVAVSGGDRSLEQEQKPLSVHQASKTSQWVSSRRHSSAGWRVHFSNGAPSFYFDPFTRDDIDAMVMNCLETNVANPPYVMPAGTLFDWKVSYAPLVRRAQDNELIARAKLTTRAQLSVEDADAMLIHADINSWPFIVTPMDWTPDLRDGVSRQVLQQFNKEAHVMVCDIPGEVRFRYIHTARRSTWVDENGKQTVAFVTVITDSDANRRNRAAEQYQNEVHWVCEGGTIVKFTEVDDTSIEVAYDHWASCQSERHAHQLFAQWGEFSSRWSQTVMSMNPLESTNTCDEH